MKRFLFLLLLVTSTAAFSVTGFSARADEADDFHMDLHGYFRTRLVSTHGFPMLDQTGLDANGVIQRTSDGFDDGADFNYGYMRLRLDPVFRYGSDPLNPVVALKSQFDFLDNVVFGDNARQGSVPLFAEDPSTTDIFGRDQSFVKLRRLWLEVSIGIGQLRIGRQPSQGGLGLLFNDGNGFRNEFGDAERGSTFDRIAFVTRPITVFNALAKGDKRPTPLVFLLAYDWLVEDALGVAKAPEATTTRLDRGLSGFLANPICPDPDNNNELHECDDDVVQLVTGLIWLDPANERQFRKIRKPEMNLGFDIFSSTDELVAGYIFVWRSQAATQSNVYIHDAFLRYQMAMGYGMPSIYVDTEMTMIKGESKGISLRGGFSDPTGQTTEFLEADVFNMVARLGVKNIKAQVLDIDIIGEGGHSSGDSSLFNETTFEAFAMNEDYKVGLITYPIALTGRSYNGGGNISGALGSGGGIWNSTYLFPHFRLRPTNGLLRQTELVGAVLLSWADTLSGGDVLDLTSGSYFVPREDPTDRDCSPFQSDCMIGTEFDIALKVKWIPNQIDAGEARDIDNYMMRWSTEFGYMIAGKALAGKLYRESIWTLQSRIAMVF